MPFNREKYQELIKPSFVRKPSPVESGISSPAGFTELSSGASKYKKQTIPANKKQDQEQLSELKVKKAWEIAFGPAKSIPMNLIMSYMTGSSLQIIPIMMTLMLLWNPLMSIFTETNPFFKNLITKDNSSDILLTKTVFVLCQLLNMCIGIWKLYQMGLIPHSEADWLAWKEVIQINENVVLV